MHFGGHGSLSVELFKVKKYLKTRKIFESDKTRDLGKLEKVSHGIWRAQKSTIPELYINTVYLLLRDAKLLLRDSIIAS